MKLFADEGCNEFAPESAQDIIDKALEITARHFTYSLYQKQVDPNKTIILSNGHCVAYSAFFASVCNYLLAEHEYKVHGYAHCSTYVGKLSFFGYDVHRLFNNPAFKDHDFNIVYIGKQEYYVDPTLYDYTLIKRIRVK